MPWLRWLVAGLSLRRHVSPSAGQSRSVTDFSQSSLVFPVNIISPWLSILISSEEWKIGPLLAAVHRHSLTPLTWTTNSEHNYFAVHSKIIMRFTMSTTGNSVFPNTTDISVLKKGKKDCLNCKNIHSTQTLPKIFRSTGHTTVHPVVYCHIPAIAWLPAGAAWLITKVYKIILKHVKYRPIKKQ
jgi:hypothetical protein